VTPPTTAQRAAFVAMIERERAEGA
jgi:hypothetical protein